MVMVMTKNNQSITDEYLEYFNQYTSEYGSKTCILMEVGSFYEMQTVHNENENIGNIREVCDLLNIIVTKKNKSIESVDRSNPYFAGFPKYCISKYMPILLEAGYTVVLVDQLTSDNDSNFVKTGKRGKQRGVVGVYSPGIQPLDLVTSSRMHDKDSITSIVLEVNVTSNTSACIYSVCNVNLGTNTFDVYQGGGLIDASDGYETILDELYKIKIRYNASEYLVRVILEHKELSKSVPKQLTRNFLCEYLDITGITCHFDIKSDRDVHECMKVHAQNDFLLRAYQHVHFGLLKPIEYFDLEKLQLATYNITMILKFIAKHDMKYISNIAHPKVINEYDYLVLEMNTLRQLSILPNKMATSNYARFDSVMSVIDKTKTAVGKRYLKSLLCKPLKTFAHIQDRYNLSDCLERCVKSNKVSLDDLLDEICDFERLFRKMSLGLLQPFEFYTLHTTFLSILEIIKYVQLNEELSNLLRMSFQLDVERCGGQLIDCINTYNNVFELENLKKVSLGDAYKSSISGVVNVFKHGVHEELDVVCNKISGIERDIEMERIQYENCIQSNMQNNKKDKDYIKLVHSEADGYHFICTKIRSGILVKHLPKEVSCSLTVKHNTSTSKIWSESLKMKSNEMLTIKELQMKMTKTLYTQFLENLYGDHKEVFSSMIRFVQCIDVSYSNMKCKNMYNYCKPIVIDEPKSFIRAQGIRHAIIERINDTTEYVENDITLDNDNCGMVLYALNSCGKSSLLRSIGICVVLAQCGLYVPCKSFTYAPFHSIITQVDLYDDMWKGQSSFVYEMVGLKKMLKLAHDRSLVLCDELTKGTEVVSATSIFAACVLELVKKQSKFVFTTHLQDVAKLDEIKCCKQLQICHLSVNIQPDNTIVFERILKSGPCSELYGLEVAKAVGLDTEVIDMSFKIRNRLVSKGEYNSTLKKSRYNAKKMLRNCEICGYKPINNMDIPLDTHHIKFQCTADDNNFIGHHHKNAKFNLVCLCKVCHIDVHNQKYIINGYKQTSNGVKLDFKQTEITC